MKRLLKRNNKGLYEPVQKLTNYATKTNFLYQLGKFAGQVEDLMEENNIESIEELRERIK